jgi:hypothetical protein
VDLLCLAVAGSHASAVCATCVGPLLTRLVEGPARSLAGAWAEANPEAAAGGAAWLVEGAARDAGYAGSKF